MAAEREFSQARPYLTEDIGCYVDGARGIYAIDRIVEIAGDHGMTELDPCDSSCPIDHVYTGWAECEYANEVEDDCNDYMNERHAVDGASWGRNENGDWGLWGNE